MNPKVTVIDSGMGNIFSICNALNYCGATVKLSSSSKDILSADRIVLPGVGAFRDGMKAMNATGLDETVLSFAKKGRPILGICVGMQILLGKSLEFGEWDGLNLIPGKVVRIPDRGEDGSAHKIPHIGWNRIFPPSSDDHIWPLTILSDFPHNRMVYFVHSFHAVPKDKNHILAICDYHGIKVTAAVRKENIYGCQFHPEKSGENGLRIFRSFIGLM